MNSQTWKRGRGAAMRPGHETEEPREGAGLLLPTRVSPSPRQVPPGALGSRATVTWSPGREAPAPASLASPAVTRPRAAVSFLHQPSPSPGPGELWLRHAPRTCHPSLASSHLGKFSIPSTRPLTGSRFGLTPEGPRQPRICWEGRGE